MMKIFIGIKYKDNRSTDLIEGIKSIIRSLGHEPYSFTEEGYIEDEKEMTQRAFQKLDECDILLLEASEPSFGIGIEAGYAFARNKKVITIVSESKRGSRTLKGISHYYLPYKNLSDLKEKFQEILSNL